ncbi:trypco2 family protein [Streptomyces sp. NPDC060006]|uniref:trypco2 family protein n=1 Tax=unclassified Streptomyces TaxID=2593676 RepID=UPI0036996E24
MDDAVELADLIAKLRSELTRAMLGGEGKDLRFRAETVELELTVAVEKVVDPSVKMRFWVLEGGAGARRGNTATQTLRLTLKPERADMAGQPALIGGDAEDGEE